VGVSHELNRRRASAPTLSSPIVSNRLGASESLQRHSRARTHGGRRLAALAAFCIPLIVATAGSVGCGHAIGPVYIDSIQETLALTGSVYSGPQGLGAYAASDIALGNGEVNSIPNAAMRGFVGFDLGSMPQGVQVVDAILVLQPCFILGSPYAALPAIHLGTAHSRK
jgi:hypothetical protein